MITITARVDRAMVQAVQRRLSKSNLNLAVRLALLDAVDYVKEGVRRALPHVTGTARGSLLTEVRGTTIDTARGTVYSPLLYVKVLELGRRPGAKPPPVVAIQRWATAVLGKSDWLTALRISRAIGRRGLPARHFFEDTAKRTASTVEKIFYRWMRQL